MKQNSAMQGVHQKRNTAKTQVELKSRPKREKGLGALVW